MGESVLTVGAAVHGFPRIGGVLHCEEVSLDALATAVGTPAYVYSANVIRDRYRTFAAALDGLDATIHYSVKANSNVAILALLRELGAGVDIVSGGELYRALHAGFRGADVVFSGVGKTAQELAAALSAGVKSINVESPAELELLNRVAQEMGVVAPVALRVNPDVSVDTPHPYTRTGEHGMKFGIPDDQIVEVARTANTMANIELVGVAAHIGSQISDPDPYTVTAEQLAGLVEEIRQAGVTTLRYIDIGGGLAVTYEDEIPTDLQKFAAAIRPVIQKTGLSLLLEPGRYLVADAGVLLTRVIYRKHSGGKEIVITDAGMNDLIRPALYEAYHTIDVVQERDGQMVADIVGPICESGDFFAFDREIGVAEAGDLLAIQSAGAYGFSMASNYNSHPRATEVLVDGSQYAVIRRRETYEDLVDHETVTPTWKSC